MMLHHILYQVTDERLCEIHIVFEVIKRHLGFNHPKLCQVSGRIAVFCTEGRSERIDLCKSHRPQFSLKLSAHSEVRALAKKVFSIINRPAVGSLGCSVHRQSGNTKSFSCPLCIAGRDDWGMHIDETAFIEKAVHGKC